MKTKKMRDHYDFSKMKGRKNPLTKYLKQPMTMRLDRDTVSYFKDMTEESGIPYQTLISPFTATPINGRQVWSIADRSAKHTV